MSEAKPERIIVVAGPTAVGKSSFALALAEGLGAEIVSIDSVQIYRHLDIGTAKASREERARVPHHLIDELDPDEACNVADFVGRAREAIAEVHGRGKPVVAVGGTNLYVRVLVHGIFEAPEPDEEIRARHQAEAAEHGSEQLHARLARVDPTLAERVHPNDLVRISRGLEIWEQTGRPLSQLQEEHRFQTPHYDALKLALVRPREELYARIDQRVEQMIEAGLVEEYRGLMARGYGRELKPLTSLGYRHMAEHLIDEVPLEEVVGRLKRDTRRFAKQQLSWLRSEQGMRWAAAPLAAEGEVLEDVRSFLEGGEPELGWTRENEEEALR